MRERGSYIIELSMKATVGPIPRSRRLKDADKEKRETRETRKTEGR